jgi:hypothetical protein
VVCESHAARAVHLCGCRMFPLKNNDDVVYTLRMFTVNGVIKDFIEGRLITNRN